MYWRLRAGRSAGKGRLHREAYRLLPDSPCRLAGRDYEIAFGAEDYCSKPLRDLKRLNVGPEK